MVVVFPSLPVIPIVVPGHSSNTSSISEVSIAPLSISFCICGKSGLQDGLLNITSNPTNFDK